MSFLLYLLRHCPVRTTVQLSVSLPEYQVVITDYDRTLSLLRCQFATSTGQSED